VIGLITAVAAMGVNVDALVAGLGLTGFGVGLAMKETLPNILAGGLIIGLSSFPCRRFYQSV